MEALFTVRSHTFAMSRDFSPQIFIGCQRWNRTNVDALAFFYWAFLMLSPGFTLSVYSDVSTRLKKSVHFTDQLQ
jgi:hypothetical protein